MFWNDISEIKEWMVTIAARLTEMQMKHLENDDDDFNSITRLHDKIDTLLKDANRLKQVALAEKTLDKFEDYMKNVDKLNSMINEFKGCISMSRAAIAERKQLQSEFDELINIGKISKEIYKSMQSFINAGSELEHKNYFKLDAIYRKVCDIEEEKPKKKGNSRRKKASNPSS